METIFGEILEDAIELQKNGYSLDGNMWERFSPEGNPEAPFYWSLVYREVKRVYASCTLAQLWRGHYYCMWEIERKMSGFEYGLGGKYLDRSEGFPEEECRCRSWQRCDKHGICMCTVNVSAKMDVNCTQFSEVWDASQDKRDKVHIRFMGMVNDVVAAMPSVILRTALVL